MKVCIIQWVDLFLAIPVSLLQLLLIDCRRAITTWLPAAFHVTVHTPAMSVVIKWLDIVIVHVASVAPGVPNVQSDTMPSHHRAASVSITSVTFCTCKRSHINAFLCLCSPSRWGCRQYVFGLSVCLCVHVSACSKRAIANQLAVIF